jgi:hypothetical protein
LVYVLNYFCEFVLGIYFGLSLIGYGKNSYSLNYLTLRSISSLNNPQNSEMKICEKYEVDMLKIIIIGYTLNNFTTHITILE